MSRTFSSLHYASYRRWFVGGLIANTGTWMQRIAQDWLVLKILTEGSGTQVGVVTALQFGPALIFGPLAGVLADRFDPKKIMFITQSLMMLLAGGLGLDVALGAVRLWHVYLFALALGVIATMDSAPRMVFVGALVPSGQLSNAVALNAASFNAARMLGPAVAGFTIAALGPAWVFFVNGVSFLGPILALALIRRGDLEPLERAKSKRGQIRAGIAYVRSRQDIMVILTVIGIVSMFGLNFQLTMGVMATNVFDRGPEDFGLLGSIMAIGSLSGALVSARNPHPGVRHVIGSAFAFGLAATLASLAPNYWLFALALMLSGFSALLMITAANSTIQLSTESSMRGRVVSIYTMVLLGVTPVGSPFIGWVADAVSARWAIGVGAIASVLVAALAGWWAMRNWEVHLSYQCQRPFLEVYGPRERAEEAESEGESGRGQD